MRVIVAGGGKIGFYLSKTLRDRHHQVSLIEVDRGRADSLANQLPGCTVICGDATDPSILADAGVEEADTLAAVTGLDEENLVICQLAKRRFGLRRVIARVSNPKNEPVLKRLGVDHVVSSTTIIADLIERELAREVVRTLLTFHHGDMTILEVDLPESSPAVGKAIRELAVGLPGDCVLVSIIRKDSVIFPRGDTVLEAGDAVLALATHASEPDLRALLLGERL